MIVIVNGWFGYWESWAWLVATTIALWAALRGIFFIAHKLGLILVYLLFFLSACGFPAWRDQALRDVAEDRRYENPAQSSSGSASSQTIEFYDAGGKHLGYGKVQGGTSEFFNADGSRVGFGRR